MSISKRLEDDLKQAMRDRRTAHVACIRMIRSKLQEREVALRSEKGKEYKIDDAEAISVITSYAKQRRDSILSYREAGRDELVAGEQEELEIVTEYLPKQLDEDELRELIRQAIAESGASSAKDLGGVMRLVVPKVKGRADGKQVSRLAQEMLAG